jgi:hypothetical protein
MKLFIEIKDKCHFAKETRRELWPDVSPTELAMATDANTPTCIAALEVCQLAQMGA